MTPLIRFTLAWLGGLVLGRWFEPPGVVLVLAAVPAAGALVLYRNSTRAKMGALVGLVLLAGSLRFLGGRPAIDETHIAFYNDGPGPVKVTGVVTDEPDIRDYRINLRLRVDSLTLKDEARPVGGTVLVQAPRYPEYRYGDRLTVSGRLETPPVFEDFSYKDYLARFGIYALIRRPRIEHLESQQGHPFWAAMFAFKARASQTINHILAEPYASLLNGILLGIETGIPDDLYEQFNLTGASHIIVISGSNIALIAGIFLLLGQRLAGKRAAAPIAIVGIVLYTFLVGADAAVSRAAIMGLFWVLAMVVGRPGLALNSLFASALLLSLIKPLILWDVGFQLSFTATLGLIILVPPLERIAFALLRRRLKGKQVGLAMALLSELLIVTLAAQISTGPLIVYHFGRFSLISLATNLLILPVQPLIMLAGGLATLAGLVWLPLGQFIGWVVWLPLAWSVWVVEHTAALPYASLEFGAFPLWLLILIYAALAAGVWRLDGLFSPDQKQTQPRFHLPSAGSVTTRLWLGGMGCITLLVWLAVLSLPDGRLHVAFLDVGQGDAILITLPDGRQILVDGGPSAAQLTWRLGQEMPFWDRSLDLIINTHPDADHLGGLAAVVDRYQVDQVLVTDVGGESQLYQAWAAELAEDQLRPVVGQTGMQLTLGRGLTATLLSPGPFLGDIEAPNNRSVVLHLQYGAISFLLTGDIEADVERKLVAAGLPVAAAVLKSPHHGSKTSSSLPFLEAVDPQVVVVSVGADNRFGHPAPEVLERYIDRGLTVLRTDEQGTIEMSTDGRRLWIETAR